MPEEVPTNDPAETAGLPAESDLSPGWDEPPDAPVRPDSELSEAEVRELLRTRADVSGSDTACLPEEVAAEFVGFDAATGHRFTWLQVTNTADRRCVVDGVVGIGVRGEWGNKLMVAVSPRTLDSGEKARPIELAPGDSARAMLEWTGSLAGAESERASMVVVQLARGQVPLRLSATNREDPDIPFDIGMDTTVYVRPFVPHPGQ